MDYIVRYAEDKDISLLHEHDHHVSPAELESLVAQKRVIVMCRGDELIGWLRYNLFWDNTPFMNMLYLLDGYRGQGLGSRLVDFWEARMREQGYDTVLTSTLSNEQAQFFYRKHGYVDCGSLLLPGDPLEIIFLKELA